MSESVGPAEADARSRRVLAERLRLIITQTPQGVVAPAALAVISAALVWNQAPKVALCGALGALALAAWLVFYRRFRRSSITDDDVEAWERGAALRTLAHGVSWGIYSLVSFSPGSFTYQSLDVAFMYGLVAGAVVVDAPHFKLFSLFALPTLLPVILRCFGEGTATSIGVGVAGLVGLGHGLFAAKSSERTSVGAIVARFRNLDLVQALEQQRELAERARLEAEAANRAKSRFLAAASHDLRQPVLALSLFTESLKGARTDAEREHLAQRIGVSVAALSASFDALLEISRLDAGALAPRVEAVALRPLLQRLADEIAVAAAERGLRVVCRCPPLSVQTDALLLERILRNLLQNALRYTERGGILLAGRRRGRGARIEVYDTGIGIAPEQQALVFEEFYQVGNPARDGQNGVGLGLAIVKRCAALLGHPLELRSGLGRGTRMALTVLASEQLDTAPTSLRAPGS